MFILIWFYLLKYWNEEAYRMIPGSFKLYPMLLSSSLAKLTWATGAGYKLTWAVLTTINYLFIQ